MTTQSLSSEDFHWLIPANVGDRVRWEGNDSRLPADASKWVGRVMAFEEDRKALSDKAVVRFEEYPDDIIIRKGQLRKLTPIEEKALRNFPLGSDVAIDERRIMKVGRSVGQVKDHEKNGQVIVQFMDKSSAVYSQDELSLLERVESMYVRTEGASFKGTMRDGKFHGHGTMKYKNGAEYEGEYRNGLRHGIGKLKSSFGNIYEGNFQDGKRIGKGREIFHESSGMGCMYIGDHEDDMWDGKGKLISATGRIFHDGEWERNAPVRSSSPRQNRRSLQVGSRVELHGLEKIKPELEGKRGRILGFMSSYMDEYGFCSIKLENGRQLELKPKYFRIS